eukprot:7047548-Pyramimonas_sp.AAC.1
MSFNPTVSPGCPSPMLVYYSRLPIPWSSPSVAPRRACSRAPARASHVLEQLGVLALASLRPGQ